MDSTDRFNRRETTIYREEADGAFLLDPDSGDLKFMNRTGREIYRMLDGWKDLDAIVAGLRDLYPDAHETALRKDAESFLQELAQAGLILADTEPSHEK